MSAVPWAWPPSARVVPPPPSFPGFQAQLPTTTTILTLLAGGTVDMPGPAAGFVRFFLAGNIVATTFGLTATLVTAQVLPAALLFQQPGSVSTQQFLACPPLLGGESLRFTSGGANGCTITLSHFDVPVDGHAAVRTTVAFAAPTTLIAAPASGSRQIVSMANEGAAGAGVTVGFAAARSYNADIAAGHSMNFFLNAVFLGRAPNVAAGASSHNFSVPVAVTLTPATGDLSAQLTEAVAVNPVNVFVLYQDF